MPLAHGIRPARLTLLREDIPAQSPRVIAPRLLVEFLTTDRLARLSFEWAELLHAGQEDRGDLTEKRAALSAPAGRIRA